MPPGFARMAWQMTFKTRAFPPPKRGITTTLSRTLGVHALPSRQAFSRPWQASSKISRTFSKPCQQEEGVRCREFRRRCPSMHELQNMWNKECRFYGGFGIGLMVHDECKRRCLRAYATLSITKNHFFFSFFFSFT